jgi:hypothetical protein
VKRLVSGCLPPLWCLLTPTLTPADQSDIPASSATSLGVKASDLLECFERVRRISLVFSSSRRVTTNHRGRRPYGWRPPPGSTENAHGPTPLVSVAVANHCASSWAPAKSTGTTTQTSSSRWRWARRVATGSSEPDGAPAPVVDTYAQHAKGHGSGDSGAPRMLRALSIVRLGSGKIGKGQPARRAGDTSGGRSSQRHQP